MSLFLGNYLFDGPFPSPMHLKDKSGILAILFKKGDTYKVLDIGESSMVQTRGLEFEKQSKPQGNCNNEVVYAAYYTDYVQQNGRIIFEQKLRTILKLNSALGKNCCLLL